MIKKISILLLVKHDRTNIRLILDKIREVQLEDNISKEVIVVYLSKINDPVLGIEDDPVQCDEFSVRSCSITPNKSTGKMVQETIQTCSGDFLLIQELGVHFDSTLYKTLLAPVFKGGADVVYGSRYKGGNAHRTSAFFHNTFNKFLTKISNMFTNLNLTDVTTSYKLIRTDIAKRIVLKEECYAIELVAKVSRIKEVKIYEVGVSYHGEVCQVKSRAKLGAGIRGIYSVLKYNLLKG
ncbi:MAG: glycosyltransferase family 2 protein [Flavobacteriales bacterium]|nr:glycosyltransferase family 2 protein [Flavobacteriales bacterium]